MPDPLGSLAVRFITSGLAGMHASSSTGASFIAGVAVSIRGVWVDTGGEVLCGKVPLRETGEMGPSAEARAPVVAMVGGDTGPGVVILEHKLFAGRLRSAPGCGFGERCQSRDALPSCERRNTLQLFCPIRLRLRQRPRPNKAPAGA